MQAFESAWRPVPQVRAYEQVLLQVEQQIADGALRPGDRLPGERRLAELLRVSQASVREALRVLEALGIAKQVGSGPDGGSVLSGDPVEAMSTLLRLHIALANFSLHDVVPTRLLLEGWSAGEAARSHNPTMVDELRGILAKMDAPGLDVKTCIDLDTAFHLGIADASGNALVAHLMHAIRSAMHHHMVERFAELDDWRAVAASLRAEHAQLLEHIIAGDSSRATAKVERHIAAFSVRTGHFDVLRRSFVGVSEDQRVQAIIIAFCFGALMEALAGFGTPVAITAVMLIGLGFKPIKAATVALVANTAPWRSARWHFPS